MDTTRSDPGLETLSEDTLAGDPMTQFAGWLAQAQERGIPEPTAMVLATTSAGGRPRARTVLLKAHGPEGFTFYTNRTSRKGQDLQVHPRACAVFPWYALGRQVTAEGGVRMMSQASSEPYFRSRPRGSQIGAWASRQSQVIELPRGTRPPCRGTGAALAGGRPDARFLGRVRAHPRDGRILAVGRLPAA